LEIRPQSGPQEAFLSSSADIAVYGGAAGGGKSYGLLLEPLRHIYNKEFGGVIFRRTLSDTKKQGSLWDTSMHLYGAVGARPRQDNLSWTFPGRARITFGHLEHETTVLDWQGAQLAFIGFDELTHFTRGQFFYMLSRNRSTCGIKPYIRATTNPDADSWVAELIAWWINQDTGSAIPERSGVIRWFARVSDELCWGESKEELTTSFPGCEPKSLTFIPARLEDNVILMRADPGYRANLLALPRVERERLLGGNWKVRPSAGAYFQRKWCQVIDAVPVGTRFVRGWDLAATAKTEGNDPDWTAATRIGRMPNGRFVVAHHFRMRGTPNSVEQAILNISSGDGRSVRIAIPQDPGQAGKGQAANLARLLAGYDIRIKPVSSSRNLDDPERNPKLTRFRAFSAQAEVGNVDVLRGDWNDQWFTALEAFPESSHDDDVDSTSEAFNLLTGEAVVPIVLPFVHSVKREFPG
jgi:predicted phage terminase large subunit-like protein